MTVPKSKVPYHPGHPSIEYECDLLGVTLTCFFFYEAPSRGLRSEGLQMEPDYPATYTLMHAYTPEGLDISPVMKMDMIEDLEEEAYARWEE